MSELFRISPKELAARHAQVEALYLKIADLLMGQPVGCCVEALVHSLSVMLLATEDKEADLESIAVALRASLDHRLSQGETLDLFTKQ